MADYPGSDPYRQFNFLVEIDGMIIGGFSEASGLTAEVTVGDYRDGGPACEVGRRMPGARKAARITLRRGMTWSKKLLDWCQAALKGGRAETPSATYLGEYVVWEISTHS